MRERLLDQGLPANLNRVARLIAKDDLKVWPRRMKRGMPPRPPKIRPEGVQSQPKRNFFALEPDTKWVNDINEIASCERKLHPCIVLDLCNKLVMDCSMHPRRDRHMVGRAEQMTAWQHDNSDEVILHLDHGGQFISDTHRKLLGSHALVCSMSAVGNFSDNAACEGVFRLLKREWFSQASYRARTDVFAYLERFHNRQMRRRVALHDREFQALIEPYAETGQNPLPHRRIDRISSGFQQHRKFDL